jgi:acetylornithine/N-succinyldiaminopimelate aminotransferase
MMNTIMLEDTLGITFCNRQPLAIEAGRGGVVWDEAGREYLDFTAGWGVTSLGHAHPRITEALGAQAAKIIQNPNSGFTYSPTRARLLALLQRVLPDNLSHVYFANSGAEANDAALKLARKVTGKSKVIATCASFHGRTFNTLSVSGGVENTSRYLPSQPGNCFVEFGDIDAMARSIDSETAAVILEPVQGEGGVRIPPDDYLPRVGELCKSVGALLIIDEIQTGFCRTGKFFGLQHSATEVLPDLLTMGKGIAGGFPFAAFAVTPAVNAQLVKGDHGGTYCGNPLGCAVSLAVVDYLIEEDVAARVTAAGQQLLAGLRQLQRVYPTLIREVRGRGLLCALELPGDGEVQAVTQACLDLGLIVTPTRNRVVRLIPYLLVTSAEIEEGLRRLDVALSRVVHCL